MPLMKNEIIINVIFKNSPDWDLASFSLEGLGIFKLAHLKFTWRPGFSNAEIESKIFSFVVNFPNQVDQART